jgi:DNA repair protein RadC
MGGRTTALRWGKDRACPGFVHNHPSGDPTPSCNDCDITVQLAKAAETLSIPMLDHVIVGDSSYFSFFDEGMARPET